MNAATLEQLRLDKALFGFHAVELDSDGNARRADPERLRFNHAEGRYYLLSPDGPVPERSA